MSPADVALPLLHFTEDTGLLVAIGAIVVRRLGRMRPRLAWVEPPLASALLLAAAGGAGLLLLEHSWLVGARLGAETGAWLLCTRGSGSAAPVALFAAALLAVTGHAARVTPAAGAELVDALHVLSAGMWGGGVIAMACLAPPGGWASAEARSLLDRFGRIALIAFGVTALTGLLRASEQLTGLDQVWTTAYGITLAAKSGGVIVMLGLAALWKRGHAVGAADALVAAAVLLATGLLAVLPPPA